MTARVLVLGPARSGSTWVGNVLGRARGASYVHEPDDPVANALALRAYAGTGRHAVTEWPTAGPPAAGALFDAAFAATDPGPPGLRARVVGRLMGGATRDEIHAVLDDGAPQWTGRLRTAAALARPHGYGAASHARVVKTVRAIGLADWLVDRYQPRVVITRRDPLEIVGSRLALGFVPQFARIGSHVWGVPVSAEARTAALDGSAVERTAFLVGVQLSALAQLVVRRPECVIADHGELCAAPEPALRRVVHAVGLEWTDETGAFANRSNAPGSAFETARAASDEPGKWRQRLSESDRATTARVLDAFPDADPAAWARPST